MESMRYAEAVVKEFLLFRGFTRTLHVFDAEIEADVGRGFQVDRIIDLLFTVYIPRFEADNLIKLMAFLRQTFFSLADARYHSSVRKLEMSLKKYYIVHAVQKGRLDQVLHFFERHGDALLSSGGDDWHSWFALPYMKNPSGDPHFQVYFSKEWLDMLTVSIRNLFAEVFDSIRLPVLLRLHNERLKSRGLKQALENLRVECTQLQTMIQAKEDEISNLKRDLQSQEIRHVAGRGRENKIVSIHSGLSSSSSIHEGDRLPTVSPSLSEMTVAKTQQEQEQLSEPNHEDIDASLIRQISSKAVDTELQNGEPIGDAVRSWSKEEEIPRVVVESQVGWRHSPAIRPPSHGVGFPLLDQTLQVRQLTGMSGYGHQMQQHQRPVMLLYTVEPRSWPWSGRTNLIACVLTECALQLLLGTAEGAVKAWNVEAKRVVCDVSTDAAFPRILELKCSPTDSLFVSVASSHPRNLTQGAEAVGFGSLSVWNMRTWKLMNILPLGEDPPVVTSICFNHNGKLVAAGATDGMIRIFDMNGCLPITGWPAYDGCAVSSVRFGHDHSSIFSLSSNGKVLEWSLHNQGQILQSLDASMFCSIDGSKVPRHEMALDYQGRRLLLSSNLHSAPLFKFHGSLEAYRTLNHNNEITSVDWHPLLPMFLTGSSDHSVRVTSIL